MFHGAARRFIVQYLARLYHGQALMLFSILFARLAYIFKDTALKIAKCTVIAYATTAVMMLALVTVGNILFYQRYGNFEQTGLILIGLSAFCFVIVLVLLNALFINKLIRVRKMLKGQKCTVKDDNLVNIITKTAILCFVSTISTFAFLSSFLFRNVWDSPFYWVLVAILLTSDIYANYLSILLSFKRFNIWYLRLCGCCDRKCHSFWEAFANRKSQSRRQQELVLQTSHSATNTNSGQTSTVGKLNHHSDGHGNKINNIIRIPSRSPSVSAQVASSIDESFVD